MNFFVEIEKPKSNPCKGYLKNFERLIPSIYSK